MALEISERKGFIAMNGSILYVEEELYTEFDSAAMDDLKIHKIQREVNQANLPFVETMYRRKPIRLEDVTFRLSCMEEVEKIELRADIAAFLAGYIKYLEELENSRKLPQKQTKQKWALDAAVRYCDSILALRDGLARAGVKSKALVRFLECLSRYTHAEDFITLHRDARRCAGRLRELRYTIEVCLNQSKVRVTADKDDLCETDDLLHRVANRFRNYELNESMAIVPFPGVHMGTLELSILEQLHALFPEAFLELDTFCRNHETFDTCLIDKFVDELQFYLSYIQFMDRLREHGVGFCYPIFSTEKTIRMEGGYELGLVLDGAENLSTGDFTRAENQSFLITGPNQGGKTTYVTMIGQMLYLASLGLPVPCRTLQTYYLRGLYTHFAKNEDLSTNAGRLKEELLRVKSILDRMPEDSLVIFNDLFASTTTYDARQMGRQILERFAARSCLCLFVTHIGDLARDCPGLVRLYATREGASGAYAVRAGEADAAAYRNPWMARYRLRCEDIVKRVNE